MIVILNNGTRIKISKESAHEIFKVLLKSRDGAERWHCMADTVSDQLTAFNMLSVSAICAEEDIVLSPAGVLEEIGLFLDILPAEDAHGRFWAEKFRRFVVDKKSTL